MPSLWGTGEVSTEVTDSIQDAGETIRRFREDIRTMSEPIIRVSAIQGGTTTVPSGTVFSPNTIQNFNMRFNNISVATVRVSGVWSKKVRGCQPMCYPMCAECLKNVRKFGLLQF